MKKISVVCLILFLSARTFAQQNEPDKGFYTAKYEKYKTLKGTGAGITMASAVIFGAGLIIGLNSSETTTSTTGGPTQTSSTGNLQLDQNLLLLGGAGLGVGIPLWIVGAHSEKKYKNKMDGVSLAVIPHINGLTLRLKF